MTSISLFAQTTGFEAISQGQGVSISVTGMLIVFLALTLISLFIRLLPTILEWLEPILPRLESHTDSPSVEEQLPTDEERIVAAIGYILHLEMEQAASKPN